MKTATAHDPQPPATTYAQLVDALAPRPLHDEADYQNALEMAGRLVGHELNADQADYLDALAVFIERYEAQHASTRIDRSATTGTDLLQHLMDEHGMTASAVAEVLGVDQSLISHIFGGRREITWAHAKTLGRHFGLTPTAFMDE